jgi:uncharacterized protein involved in exopolysaccharide biosynthesis
MSGEAFTLQSVLMIWHRRKLPMLLGFAAIMLLFMMAAVLWPSTYVSTATILIEQQEVPSDLVRSTITSFADQRIQTINQRVMTSDNLLGIVEKFNLYPQQRERAGRERVLDMIRRDISFGSIKASVIDPRQGKPVEATLAFSLGYRSSSPTTAARVANELSTLYLQENLQSRRQLVDEAASFLTTEADKLSKRIEELQGSLAEFKERHIDNLPEQATLNLQMVNRADDERRDADTQISALNQQIVYLEAQLAQLSKTSPVYASTGERVMSSADRLKYLRSEYARVSAIYSPGHPDVERLKREIESLSSSTQDPQADNERRRELQDAQTELAAARQRYAPNHPDVRRLERRVATLSDPAIARVGVNTQTSSEIPDNPAYIQVQAQLEATRAQRTALQRKRAELTARVATLEGRLAAAPGVEKDYTSLLRELEGTQAKYSEVRQKQMEAQLAQSLEAGRKGERFSLIEPPVVPDGPSSPNRKLIFMLGLVLALAVAGGVGYLLETLDGSIRGRGDILTLLAVPPLAVIPWFESAEQIAARKQRQRYTLYGSVAAGVLMLIVVHTLFRPLDVLWAVVMRQLGG